METSAARKKQIDVPAIAGKVAGGIAFAIAIFIGLKSCTSTAWVSPKSIVKYSVVGADGRGMSVFLLRDHEMVVAYEDPSGPAFEVIVASVYGNIADHYIGPIWKHEDDFLGWAWVKDGTEPVKFYLTIKDKLHVGRGESSFASIGSETAVKARISEGKLKIFGNILDRSQLSKDDEEFLSNVMRDTPTD